MIGSGNLSASGGGGFGNGRVPASRETALTLRTKLGLTAITFPASGLLLHAGQLGIPGGIATLDGSGKLTPAQLPPLALAEFLGATATEAAMLALTGTPGDWTVRSDLGTMFILTSADESLLASWTEFDLPGSPVTSVAGRTGAVVLTKSDVGLANVNNTADANKPVSNAVASALTGRVPTTRTINGYPLTANITLTAADLGVTAYTLPAATAGALGGVKRTTVPADNFVNGIDAAGNLTFGIPAGTGGGGGGSYTLPAPTTTTLGGVLRNTGYPGQYVSGIDASGNLLYGTPIGVGGGSGGSVPVPITVVAGALTPLAPSEGALQSVTPAASFTLHEPATADVGSRLEVWITAPATDILMTLHGSVGLADSSHIGVVSTLVAEKTYILLFKRLRTDLWALVSITGGF